MPVGLQSEMSNSSVSMTKLEVVKQYLDQIGTNIGKLTVSTISSFKGAFYQAKAAITEFFAHKNEPDYLNNSSFQKVNLSHYQVTPAQSQNVSGKEAQVQLGKLYSRQEALQQQVDQLNVKKRVLDSQETQLPKVQTEQTRLELNQLKQQLLTLKNDQHRVQQLKSNLMHVLHWTQNDNNEQLKGYNNQLGKLNQLMTSTEQKIASLTFEPNSVVIKARAENATKLARVNEQLTVTTQLISKIERQQEQARMAQAELVKATQHHKKCQNNMAETLNIGDSGPWGMRGDEKLYPDLKAKLAGKTMPDTKEKYLAALDKEFKALTGSSAFSNGHSVSVQQYNNGISGGTSAVSLSFWAGTFNDMANKYYP
ncbi:hypothetical protein [uncultured Shewanella sp.]|uniref:hypothetical protein n=1 Tax=uncultured Shewanella sp. TaxID=173975 RepID=UPI0026338401|nr:hypothetical protein [uncultured Shewanella sp.]